VRGEEASSCNILSASIEDYDYNHQRSESLTITDIMEAVKKNSFRESEAFCPYLIAAY